MPILRFDAPVQALQIILTCTELGWNYVVLEDGKPLPSDDPVDLPSAEQALSFAVAAMCDQYAFIEEASQ